MYPATDLTAWIGKGDVKFVSATRNPDKIFVGREEAWANGSPAARMRTPARRLSSLDWRRRDDEVPRERKALRRPTALPSTLVHLLALVTNYLLGKDMASDTLGYHLYAGFNALHDRFAQDYFPAGPQSYFNPYVYVPLYFLLNTGLSSLEISSMLVVVHSVMLWLTYELAVAVCPRRISASA